MGKWNNIFLDGYTGEINERGEPHGQGVYEYADGSRYEDQWEDGEPHGQGKMTYPDGEVYEGEWKDDKPHGQGTQTKQDGDDVASLSIYVGGFWYGFREGQGILYKDASIYKGQWGDGKRHGIGEYEHGGRDGHPQFEFRGQWVNDEAVHGAYLDADGTHYIGTFSDGLFHGQGKVTYPDGEVYEGEWKNGKPHGQSTETKQDGTFLHSRRIRGLFKSGDQGFVGRSRSASEEE